MFLLKFFEMLIFQFKFFTICSYSSVQIHFTIIFFKWTDLKCKMEIRNSQEIDSKRTRYKNREKILKKKK